MAYPGRPLTDSSVLCASSCRYPRPPSASMPAVSAAGFAPVPAMQPVVGATGHAHGGAAPKTPASGPPPDMGTPPVSGFTPGDAGAASRGRPRYPSQSGVPAAPGGAADGAAGLPPSANGSALANPSVSTDPSAVFDLLNNRHVLPTSPVHAPVPQLPESHRRRNVSPKVVRSTLNRVPIQQAMLRKSKIPFAISIYPFGPEEVPCIESTVIRRCVADAR
jgi:protein transport protein SEC24